MTSSLAAAPGRPPGQSQSCGPDCRHPLLFIKSHAKIGWNHHGPRLFLLPLVYRHPSHVIGAARPQSGPPSPLVPQAVRGPATGGGAEGRGRRNNGQQDPRNVVRTLARYSDLWPGQVDQFSEAALVLLQSDNSNEAEVVIQALGEEKSGLRLFLQELLLKATADTASPAAAALQLQRHLPQLLALLQVICHPNLSNHLAGKTKPWLNHLFAAVRDSTNLGNLTTGMETLLAQSPAQPPLLPRGSTTYGTPQRRHSVNLLTWPDLAHLFTRLVTELLKRFSSPDDRSALAGPASRLLGVAERMASTPQGAAGSGGIGVGGGSGLEVAGNAKRAMTAIRNARSMLNLVAEPTIAPSGWGASSPLVRSAHAKSAVVRPEDLPGHLRPVGPRHSNDHDDFTQVEVVPPAEELLCTVPPYLPANQADVVPEHMRSRPASWSRLDTLFRLMRHDATAPLAETLQKFVAAGGVRAVTQQKQAKASKEAQFELFMYRGVQLEGLRDDAVLVTVAPPAHLTTYNEVCDWWESGRRLAHGTLLALAWEEPPADIAGAPQGHGGGDGMAPMEIQLPQQQLVLGEVVFRMQTILSNDGRPCVGVRFSEGQDAVLRALVMGAAAGREVVMLQDKNSFFAYRPFLAALQTMASTPLPLASYLLPACRSETVPPKPEVPAYLQDVAVYDLTSLLVDPSLASLAATIGSSALDRARQALSAVRMSRPDEFPLEALEAATTMDRSQAEALKAALTQEVAVVQGPPGTGKTYLSIQATRLLLQNTVGSDKEEWGSRTATGGPTRKPAIGPLLVVTFTNHALDQYLEGLLRVGVPLADVVRVGGGCKSEALQSCNLASKIGMTRPIHTIGDVRRKLEAAQEELGALLAECRRELASLPDAAPKRLQPRRDANRSGSAATRSLPPALTWRQVNEALEPCYDLQQLRQSFIAGIRPVNETGVEDLLHDWLLGSPRGDVRLGRLGPQNAAGSTADSRSTADTGSTESDNDEGDQSEEEEDEERTEAEENPDLEGQWESDPGLGAEVRGAGQRARARMEALFVGSWASTPLSGSTQGRGEMGDWQGYAAGDTPLWQQQGRQGAATAASIVSPSFRVSPAEVAEMMVRDRSQQELLGASSVWEMSRSERRRLYGELRQRRLATLAADVRDLQERLREALKDQEVERDKMRLAVLRRARVVGMTTSGLAGSQELIRALGPKVLVVEEAAEVFEAHVLTCLVDSVQQLVLIGDHEQLRPKANTYEMQAYSGKGYNLDISLFERLVTGGWPAVVTLRQQRRMRPQIADLIRAPIYPALTDHISVQAYPAVRGMVHNVFLWDHTRPDSGAAGDSDRSRSNPWEAAAVVSLARYLMQQGYPPEDVVVLVPYVGQLMAVRRELKRRNFRVIISEADADQVARQQQVASKEEDEPPRASLADSGTREALGESVRVATVDNFQGEEARIIIISATRSNSDADIGFLKMRNRVNVMLSRAKHGMYLLANTSTLLAASNTRKSPLWAHVRDKLEVAGCVGTTLQLRCERHGTITEVRDLADFDRLVGDGGCNEPCGAVLPCGHTCPRRCHVDDTDHTSARCTAPCDSLHAPCGHPCDKLCGEDCGPCVRVLAAHPLGCGHVATNVPCTVVTSKQLVCKEQVQVQMPDCGHELKVPCHSAAGYLMDPRRCSQKVEVQMALCRHSVQVPCGERTRARLQPHRCGDTCGCTLPCHHSCKGRCGGCTTNRVTKAFAQIKATVSFSGASAAVSPEAADFTASDLEEEKQLQLQEEILLRRQATTSAARGGANTAGTASTGQDTIRSLLGGRRRPGREAAGRAAAAGGGGGVADAINGAGSGSVGGADEGVGGGARSAVRRQVEALVGQAAEGNRLEEFRARLEAQLEGHAACGEVCDRNLACGHSCSATCHRGSDCPSCSRDCWIACEHHRCTKRCGEPCVPCADVCSWSCEHQGACGAPCGAPCDRLPCDERCSRLLSCGHRCPGLCGEPCPSATYCVHPDCRGRAPQRVRKQVVDFLEFRRFEDISDADVSSDPLVVLPCKHVYTVANLDAHMGMESRFYVRGSPNPDGRPGPWLGLRPIPGDQDVVKGCPDCRTPIQLVRRYGRATRKAALDLIDRKHRAQGERLLAEAQARLRGIEAELTAWPDPVPASTATAATRAAAGGHQAQGQQQQRGGKQTRGGSDKKGGSSAPVSPYQALQDVIKRYESEAGRYLDLARKLERGPKARAYEAAVSRVKKAIERSAEARQQQLIIEQAQFSGAGTTSTTPLAPPAAMVQPDTGAESPGAAAAGASGAGTAQGMPPSSHGSPGGLKMKSRLESAEGALYVLQEDWQVVWAARCGYLGAMEGVLRAVRKGLDAPAAVLAGKKRPSVGKTLAEQHRKQVTWLAMHADKRAAETLALASPRVDGQAEGYNIKIPQRRLSWVQTAASRQDIRSVLRLAAGGMAVRLAQVNTLQASRRQLKEGGRDFLEELKQLQVSILEQVIRDAEEAEGIFASSPLAQRQAPQQQQGLLPDNAADGDGSGGEGATGGEWGGDADADLRRLRQLRDQAARVKDEVERDAERLSIVEALQAVAGLEGMYGSGLSGHVYRCSNGHIYYVGDCGSPTEGACCPLCGARIGQGSGDELVPQSELSVNEQA